MFVKSSTSSVFKNILYKKARRVDTHSNNSNTSSSNNDSNSANRLLLELHYRSSATSNRFSVLINNCRVLVVLDWLHALHTFLMSDADPPPMSPSSSLSPSSSAAANFDFDIKKPPTEIKVNLTETDFVFVEGEAVGCQPLSSSANLQAPSQQQQQQQQQQAIVVRLTSFLELNERKAKKPFHFCLQSVEIFSCQVHAIGATMLKILEPTTLNVFLRLKAPPSISLSLSPALLLSSPPPTYSLDMSTDVVRLRLSYLDLRLIMRVLELAKRQIANIEHTASVEQQQQQQQQQQQEQTSSPLVAIVDVKLALDTLALYVIDDCKNIDIPLLHAQFTRFKLMHSLAATSNSSSSHTNADQAASLKQQRSSTTLNNNNKKESVGGRLLLGQGSVECALTVESYNRLLSGWEPLVEPWLVRFDWKLKAAANIFTVTSMDILNMNVTNPLIGLVTDVISNWRDDFYSSNAPSSSKVSSSSSVNTNNTKIFQPYKVVNLTGEPIRFCFFQAHNNNKNSSDSGGGGGGDDQLSAVSNATTITTTAANIEWHTIEDKCEKSLDFYQLKNVPSGSSARTHNSLLRVLVKNRIRVNLLLFCCC